MATRSSSSSSSSSSSESEVTAGRTRGASETSRDTVHTASQQRGRSPTNTIDGTSIGETTTVRSNSPSPSRTSAAVTRTAYDEVSVATTATSTSQQQRVPGGIPIIRPPVLQLTASPPIGTVVPQRPAGYPTQPPNQAPIRIDVASAHQQYQQRTTEPAVSSYTGSSTSSSAGSLSSPGGASIQQRQAPVLNQQPRFDVAKAIFNQVDRNHDGSITRDEFRQWAQPAGGQAQQQQQQQRQQPPQAQPIPASQVYNELLGPDAFKDVILDIDYGALGNLNTAFQSTGDFSGGQLPPGISIRPAYTTVDSLNYQQHMFNTARTIYADGSDNSYGYGAAGGSDNYGGGQHFDAAKAIFNQVDANHDGSITRDEFQQWAQGGAGAAGAGQQNYGGQAYSTNYQNVGAGTADYGAAGNPGGSGPYQATVLDGGNPAIANILQQSGLGQALRN